jgi:hypothetical protein
MKFLLLVTWLMYDQPASNYQVGFSSLEACEAARNQLIKDASKTVLDGRSRGPGAGRGAHCRAQAVAVLGIGVGVRARLCSTGGHVGQGQVEARIVERRQRRLADR